MRFKLSLSFIVHKPKIRKSFTINLRSIFEIKYLWFQTESRQRTENMNGGIAFKWKYLFLLCIANNEIDI